ncbi:MAG TPA: protein kinase [Gemmataceae bacterium]|nr:protein kinase [Gemmataceae bacterium]
MSDITDLQAASSPSPDRPQPETITLSLPGDTSPKTVPAIGEESGEGAARPFGDYELLGVIGRGGQGVVYRARERHSGRLVALKMMHGERAADSADLRRFVLEARATGELEHPGIVAIHAWGEHEGHPFYTMDFVPGQPLSRLLEKGPLPCHRAVRYLTGIARAVAAAHALGIVHRDLKPGNVIIDPSDRPRILDFGLAKRQQTAPVDPNEEIIDVLPADAPFTSNPSLSAGGEGLEVKGASADQLTAKGAIVGTPAYMAPEQVRAQHDRIGPPSDVYALGAIFYEMLTGRPPFQGNSMLDTLRQVLHRQPAPIRALNPRVPASLEALCQRCLEKEPGQRYPDAGALADELESRWSRITRTRHLARLTAAAGAVILALQLAQLALTHGLGINLSMLAESAGNLAGGGLFQITAEALVRLGWVVAFGLIPCLAELALGIWLGQWVWHSSRPGLTALLWGVAAATVLAAWRALGTPFAGEVLLFFPLLLAINALLACAVAVIRWGSGQKPTAEARAPGAEPFLQKLFAARVERRPRRAARPEAPVAPWLGDFELGKTVYAGEDCVVRRARQTSLDRPVLLWVDRKPPADAPLPGVVVHHLDVLALHAVGRGPEGSYLVTAPAAATPLAELIQRHGIQPGEAVVLAARLARTLQAFHEQGVYHGRLSPEWVLVHGDWEPVLCPCGVPIRSAADPAQDLIALGRLLQSWLPPAPRAWERRWLAPVYRVANAAAKGHYLRAADLADDLERAARLARIRWRHGWVAALVAGLVLLPLLVSVIDWGGRRSMYLLLSICPAALVLGYSHGRALVYRRRLRVRDAARNRVLKGSLSSILLPAVLVLAPAVLLAVTGFPGADARAGLLAGGVAVGFWLVGAAAAGLVTFGEFLLNSLRPRPADEGAWGLDAPRNRPDNGEGTSRTG